MIAGAYVLHLYCDNHPVEIESENVGRNTGGFGDFSADSEREAIRIAKKRGWTIIRRSRTAICPACSRPLTPEDWKRLRSES